MLQRSIVALLLVLPTPLIAQTVTRDGLVGTWVRNTKRGNRTTEMRLTLRPDSTWTQVTTVNGAADPTLRSMEPVAQGMENGGRWRLSGDTLWLGDPAVIDTSEVGVNGKVVEVIGSKWAMKAEMNTGNTQLLLYGYRGAYDYEKKQPRKLTCMDSYCFDRARTP